MQSLTIPTGARNPNGRSAADVLSALQAETGGRAWEFRYELLTAANVYVQDLGNVLSCQVSQDWLADIKRTARFEIRDTGEINFLQERIRPITRLLMPPFGADDWVEWPMGVFLLESPSRKDGEVEVVTRSVQAYDQLQVYARDKIAERYTVAAGAVYTTEIAALLGSVDTNITASTLTVPVALEWEPGKTKLSIINDLLSAINYESLSFDEDGRAIVRPYVAPSSRPESYTYDTGTRGLIIPGVDEELDLFSVANSWTLVVSEPDRAPLTASYTNVDPASPTSTVSRQMTITDFRTESNIADQATLDAKVQRVAFEASQVYQKLTFKTGLMPIHSGNDVLRISYPPLAIDAKFSEQSWSMNLEAGTQMTHKARRVVTV